MAWGTFILTDEPVKEPPRELLKELKKSNISNEDFFILKHGESYLID